jgi:hypothetical protein
MASFSSSYYFALTAGYAIGLLGWWIVHRWNPGLWNPGPEYRFPHPWWDLLWAFIAALCTIAVGQLYSGGMLIPKGAFIAPVAAEAMNQAIIFSPFIVLMIVRRQPLTTAWLSVRHLPGRLAVGCILAIAALCVFVLLRRPPDTIMTILGNVYHPKNVGYAVQILLEDIAIAVVFVRFRAAVGPRWFLLVLITVAFLFSASHYPAKLAEGASIVSATRDVIVDGLLVSAVIYVLQRSRDIVWFWFIHFAMDMMQFYSGSTSA